MSNLNKPALRGAQPHPRATSALRDYIDLPIPNEAPRPSMEAQKRIGSPLAGNANAMRTHSQRIK